MASDGNALGCVGFRCLDRDECYHYDENLKQAAFIHDGFTCETTLTDTEHRFRYHNLAGEVQMLNADEVQELMKCTYTSKLLFQRTHLLRNYAFWGFSDSVADGFEQFTPLTVEVSSKVAIGHVSLLSHVEEQPLGLFAAEDLERYEFLGEYTGVIKIGVSEVNEFDPYGISYPSVYEGGDLYVSASEYGNVIRCINHSATPNARFVPMVHNGILRIFCFVIQEIKQGDQIFVNYGPSYWKSTGIDPIAFHQPTEQVLVQ
ncbi:Histone-lysine N-methyltransferase MEDEA [Phytophthora citrophthora]|uniref:Histone-lysine N-methyltransferase MEDEA n=1 Tax=Phytophthora citrophthora TaxID=4793 RepID=A0AAD9LT60_9STRA|nr:Histone-lysine N-methyltransferase MEDEA [Phytophthora citrophthora]